MISGALIYEAFLLLERSTQFIHFHLDCILDNRNKLGYLSLSCMGYLSLFHFHLSQHIYVWLHTCVQLRIKNCRVTKFIELLIHT